MLSILSFSAFSQVTTFPYLEGFETGGIGWNLGGTNNSWELGIPKNSFIKNAATGQKAWVTNLDGNYNQNEASYVISPVFDFTGMDTPMVRFSQIFDIDGNNNDVVYVQFSLNNGPWSKLGTFTSGGENWYPNALNAWEDNSGEINTWRFAEQKLQGLGMSFGGQSNVRIRFYMTSDATIATEGFGFDNVMVYERDSLTDLRLVSIDSINSDCGLGSNNILSFTVKNSGGKAISNFNLAYRVNGGAVVSETVSATINPGATYNHVFSSGIDMSAVGEYNIVAYSSLNSDQYSFNDTLKETIDHIPLITTYPYIQDFESGRGGWTTNGTNNTWDYGTPNGILISSAAGGTKAWVTNLDGTYSNNETSYLISPCLDFSGFSTDPKVRFSQIFNTEQCCDNGYLEYSVNNGAWTKLGTIGSGLNWYNDGGDVWAGTSGGKWVLTQHTLTGLAGQSDVRIRFVFSSESSTVDEGFGIDNFLIFDSLDEAMIIAIDTPITSCGLGATEAIKVAIGNFSTKPISNFNVSYSINGGSIVTELISSSIAVNDTLLYTFSATADMSALGDYNIAAYTSLSGDMLPSDDTSFVLVTHQDNISTYPYLEDFESGNGSWFPSGTLASWGYGAISKKVITTASSGLYAWATGGAGTQEYFSFENSTIVSPCFDLTSLSNPYVGFDLWWDTENNTDGTVFQYSLDDGSSWINLGAFSDPNNWFNNNGITAAPAGQNVGWAGTSGNSSNGWLTAFHDLTPLIGQSKVKFRFAFASDNSFVLDGFAFDDFEIGEPPVVDLGNDTTTCSITLDVNNSLVTNSKYSYLWSTGDTTSTLDIINLDTATVINTIWVKVSNTFGYDYDTIVINVLPTPKINLGADTSVCNGGSVTLDATNVRATYNWSTLENTPIITVNTTNTYSITVTDTVYMCTNTDSILVVVDNNIPVADFDYNDTVGLTIPFTDKSTDGFYYNWDFGDGNTSTQQNPTNTYASSGAYTVTLIVSNGCGADTIIKTIAAFPVGVKELNVREELSIKIYPNPSHGSFNIVLNNFNNQNANIRILNSLGQVIINEKISNRNNLRYNLHYQNQGIYFVQIISKESIITKRILLID